MQRDSSRSQHAMQTIASHYSQEVAKLSGEALTCDDTGGEDLNRRPGGLLQRVGLAPDGIDTPAGGSPVRVRSDGLSELDDSANNTDVDDNAVIRSFMHDQDEEDSARPAPNPVTRIRARQAQDTQLGTSNDNDEPEELSILSPPATTGTNRTLECSARLHKHPANVNADDAMHRNAPYVSTVLILHGFDYLHSTGHVGD